jgi:hypothetical protein
MKDDAVHQSMKWWSNWRRWTSYPEECLSIFFDSITLVLYQGSTSDLFMTMFVELRCRQTFSQRREFSSLQTTYAFSTNNDKVFDGRNEKEPVPSFEAWCWLLIASHDCTLRLSEESWGHRTPHSSARTVWIELYPGCSDSEAVFHYWTLLLFRL